MCKLVKVTQLEEGVTENADATLCKIVIQLGQNLVMLV